MKKLILLVLLMPLFSMAAYGQDTGDNYRIGEGDMIKVSVWGSPNLDCLVPVKPGGMISVPLLGDVAASGITVHDLRANLERQYSNFVKKPDVSVLVTAVNSYKVYILGPGMQNGTGEIALKNNMTLVQLLSRTGALKGDPDGSYVLRNGKKLNVDFASLFKGDVSKDLPLKSGDIIYISDSVNGQIRVIGAVEKPTLIPYKNGMTALDAVIYAGGFNEFASRNNVYVIRKTGGKTVKLRAKLKDVMDGSAGDVALMPGDLVNVQTSFF